MDRMTQKYGPVAVMDVLSDLLSYFTSNFSSDSLSSLFVQTLSDDLDSTWKYLHLLGELIDTLHVTEPTDFRKLVRILYPFRSVDTTFLMVLMIDLCCTSPSCWTALSWII